MGDGTIKYSKVTRRSQRWACGLAQRSIGAVGALCVQGRLALARWKASSRRRQDQRRTRSGTGSEDR